MTKTRRRVLDERAQQRVDADIERMKERSRIAHPERYAPDGKELIEYAGSDWFERMNGWRRANGLPEIERLHEMHPLPEAVAPINTYSDEQPHTTKQEVPF